MMKSILIYLIFPLTSLSLKAVLTDKALDDPIYIQRLKAPPGLEGGLELGDFVTATQQSEFSELSRSIYRSKDTRLPKEHIPLWMKNVYWIEGFSESRNGFTEKTKLMQVYESVSGKKIEVEHQKWSSDYEERKMWMRFLAIKKINNSISSLRKCFLILIFKDGAIFFNEYLPPRALTYFIHNSLFINSGKKGTFFQNGGRFREDQLRGSLKLLVPDLLAIHALEVVLGVFTVFSFSVVGGSLNAPRLVLNDLSNLWVVDRELAAYFGHMEIPEEITNNILKEYINLSEDKEVIGSFRVDAMLLAFLMDNLIHGPSGSVQAYELSEEGLSLLSSLARGEIDQSLVSGYMDMLWEDIEFKRKTMVKEPGTDVSAELSADEYIKTMIEGPRWMLNIDFGDAQGLLQAPESLFVIRHSDNAAEDIILRFDKVAEEGGYIDMHTSVQGVRIYRKGDNPTNVDMNKILTEGITSADNPFRLVEWGTQKTLYICPFSGAYEMMLEGIIRIGNNVNTRLFRAFAVFDDVYIGVFETLPDSDRSLLSLLEDPILQPSAIGNFEKYGGRLKEWTAQYIVKQILKGLIKFEEQDVVHGKLTLDTVYIGPFGAEDEFPVVIDGPRYWIPGEVVNTEIMKEIATDHSFASPYAMDSRTTKAVHPRTYNLYGVGIILHQLLHGKGTFPQGSAGLTVAKYLMTDSCLDLYTKLLNLEFNSAKDVLQHKWFGMDPTEILAGLRLSFLDSHKIWYARRQMPVWWPSVNTDIAALKKVYNMD